MQIALFLHVVYLHFNTMIRSRRSRLSISSYYDELTNEEVFSLMEMNVTTTTWMTKMVNRGMVNRKRGSIANI